MVSAQQVARRVRVPLGFVFAGFFLWFARPRPLSMLLSLVLVLPGLALRGYASAYIKKNREITQTGPYAYTRNPLYLGSGMIALGFAVASRNWIVLVVLVVLFLAIYWPTILGEEEYLRANFADFDAYAAQVPRLLPRIVPAKFPEEGSAGFSRELYLKHREYNAAMGTAALYAVLAMRWWFSSH